MIVPIPWQIQILTILLRFLLSRYLTYRIKNLIHQNILFVREEEKVARDVYLHLYDLHSLQIFSKISASEQYHMDAMKLLIDKCKFQDPVEQTADIRGEFVNSELETLYQELISKGELSLEEAIKVGGYIEEMDRVDLTRRLEAVDNEDIKLVLQNLAIAI